MRRTWGNLGGQLGLGCIAVGILVIGLAWNGAAGVDFVQGQVPYLLSGGALGLALVVLGGTLVVVQSNRRDRSLLEAQLRDLNSAIARLANAVGSAATDGGKSDVGSADVVVVGSSSYHRPGCRLVADKDLPTTSLAAARAEGLTPCRICAPAGAAYEAAPR
jgi:outer membrane murein-binding lipoprotein Lpp